MDLSFPFLFLKNWCHFNPHLSASFCCVSGIYTRLTWTHVVHRNVVHCIRYSDFVLSKYCSRRPICISKCGAHLLTMSASTHTRRTSGPNANLCVSSTQVFICISIWIKAAHARGAMTTISAPRCPPVHREFSWTQYLYPNAGAREASWAS